MEARYRPLAWGVVALASALAGMALFSTPRVQGANKEGRSQPADSNPQPRQVPAVTATSQVPTAAMPDISVTPVEARRREKRRREHKAHRPTHVASRPSRERESAPVVREDIQKPEPVPAEPQEPEARPAPRPPRVETASVDSPQSRRHVQEPSHAPTRRRHARQRHAEPSQPVVIYSPEPQVIYRPGDDGGDRDDPNDE